MANNTEQELRSEIVKRLPVEFDFYPRGDGTDLVKPRLNPSEDIIDSFIELIEAEATRARIDELERINPTTEWTLSASARQSTIGERLAELKRQAKGGK